MVNKLTLEILICYLLVYMTLFLNNYCIHHFRLKIILNYILNISLFLKMGNNNYYLNNQLLINIMNHIYCILLDRFHILNNLLPILIYTHFNPNNNRLYIEYITRILMLDFLNNLYNLQWSLEHITHFQKHVYQNITYILLMNRLIHNFLKHFQFH